MHAFYAYNTCQTTPQPLSTEILTKIIWALLGLPLLTFGYIALVLRIAQHPTLSRWLAPLRAVGEMSLTNYLTPSIIGTLLACRIGLGLYGQICPAMCMPIAVAIFAVQIPLSNWWLRQFRFGPAEWLWRSATYLRMQPMRR